MQNHRSFPMTCLSWITLLGLIVMVGACKQESTADSDTAISDTTSASVSIPVFSRDTAFAYIERQLAFGPRNPGGPGISACRDWMVAELEKRGAVVIRQKFQARLHDGKVFPSENIIGQFNPENKNRIILAAHYDTRFIAEEDPDPVKQNQPIAGADDGASGVGVLLEIARLLHENKNTLGVDIIFFDAEDQGTRDSETDPNNTSWCIGAQYWSKNLHRAGYRARFGILLDMVGAKNAFFSQETVTGLYPHAQEVHTLYIKVWNLARAMGKGQYFQERVVQGIIDDHYFVNKIAGIPMIDIINKPPENPEGFGAHWHTHKDDIGIIDKNTLAAVGQVVTAIVYRTASGNF